MRPRGAGTNANNGMGETIRRSRKWTFAAAYLALLAGSHIVRVLQPDCRPADTQQTVRIAGHSINGAPTDSVVIAYRDYRPPNDPGAPILVLLHGSPMASSAFDRLVPFLRDRYRLLLPDMPGFGGSSRQVPDYGTAAHGRHLTDFLDRLGVDYAHLVAYGQGGGVALESYRVASEPVRSVTLLSSIGVQELELLGSYALNHAVHAVQLGILWVVQEGFPHFGFMDTALLNRQYARNFFDTDQRPLRRILQDFHPPMLIIHREDDHFVPVAAAREHARLVPQSRLVVMQGGHGLLFSEPDRLARHISELVDSAEAGDAPNRETADDRRVDAARVPYQPSTANRASGIGFFILFVLIVLATLISEDLTCIGAGFLVAQGTMSFMPATLACLTGIYLGDIGLFLIGRLARRTLSRRPPLSWLIDPRALERGNRWLGKRGPAVVVASRFIPGSRMPVYTAAGFFEMPLTTFSGYFLVASIIWTPVLVGLSVLIGEHFLRLFETYQTAALPVALGVALSFWLTLRLVVPLLTHRGRRLMLSSWRRLTRWEFWPMWAVYTPVLAYVLWLALRYRSLTLFTAANPGIDLGGFIGESKSAILANLRGADDLLADFEVVEPTSDLEGRVLAVRSFMRSRALQFPVVLKPDVGERGSGVAIVRSDDEVKDYVAAHLERLIVQEYAPGAEFGIFYTRYPDEAGGHIFSITDKRFPTVVGDGRRTLEQLILDDDRAVCMARHFLEVHARNLDSVPHAGQEVRLVDVGTHARGALFLDGQSVWSEALQSRIDEIAKGFDGFYFGRFDVRTTLPQSLRDGAAFKIVELNGVTSEATHIYDPSNGLLYGLRILMTQWRIAFEIGDRMRRQGVRPAGVRTLLRRYIGVRAGRWKSPDPIHGDRAATSSMP